MNIFADMPTESEIEDLYEKFCQIDKEDKKGTIDVERMANLMGIATDTKEWTGDQVKKLLGIQFRIHMNDPKTLTRTEFKATFQNTGS